MVAWFPKDSWICTMRKNTNSMSFKFNPFSLVCVSFELFLNDPVVWGHRVPPSGEWLFWAQKNAFCFTLHPCWSTAFLSGRKPVNEDERFYKLITGEGLKICWGAQPLLRLPKDSKFPEVIKWNFARVLVGKQRSTALGWNVLVSTRGSPTTKAAMNEEEVTKTRARTAPAPEVFDVSWVWVGVTWAHWKQNDSGTNMSVDLCQGLQWNRALCGLLQLDSWLSKSFDINFWRWIFVRISQLPHAGEQFQYRMNWTEIEWRSVVNPTHLANQTTRKQRLTCLHCTLS